MALTDYFYSYGDTEALPEPILFKKPEFIAPLKLYLHYHWRLDNLKDCHAGVDYRLEADKPLQWEAAIQTLPGLRVWSSYSQDDITAFLTILCERYVKAMGLAEGYSKERSSQYFIFWWRDH